MFLLVIAHCPCNEIIVAGDFVSKKQRGPKNSSILVGSNLWSWYRLIPLPLSFVEWLSFHPQQLIKYLDVMWIVSLPSVDASLSPAHEFGLNQNLRKQTIKIYFLINLFKKIFFYFRIFNFYFLFKSQDSRMSNSKDFF